MASKEISSIHIMISKLTLTSLSDIMKNYHIDFEFHPRFPEPMDAIVDALEGVAGPSPDLSLEEQRVIDLLSKNFVKWTDLEELIQLSSKSIDLVLSLEPPATCTPHECLVIIDPGLKHAEENLPSPDVEAPGSGIHLHHTLNQKLFGARFGLFQAFNIESTTITVDPIHIGLGVPGSSNLTPVVNFDTTPLFGGDSHPELVVDVSQSTSKQIDAHMPTLVTLETLFP
ncbi:unnamed protein product [Lactuca saligna]|uniref:Uncharacterized protein n=1 Tax=Lactuca saligna TaxID=75948 RepID=A0AA35VR85_LACSI|nr:unnamed protein product [Lactuca saligna]